VKRLAALLLAAAVLPAAPVQARDLGDALRGLKDKLERPEQRSAPQQQAAPRPAQDSVSLPAIPPIGNVPEGDEIKIGRYIAGNLLGAAPLVEDAALQGYVNRVGRWVAAQSERPGLPWTFGVIESSDVNAFAAPGGYVFVTRGLYALLRDEAELAGVLAHEVGHVIQKHHLKVMQKSQLIGAGGDLLARRLGSKDDRVKGLIGSGAEIMARGLDKDAEFEADRIGVVLATRAGYDSYGLPAVLQEIGHLSADSGAVALLFKTHPHPDERLARLGEAMGARFDGVADGKSLPERLQKAKK
jgi:predicted Zn-dependent protease